MSKNIGSKLLQPSEEQQHIIEHIQHGKNVIIDAIAGSGKSTTILCIANAFPNKRILQITYNSMLRKEFREKVQFYQLTNIESHTYHSLAVKYVSPHAFTDTGIRQCLNKKHEYEIEKKWLSSPLLYDMIMLDECQDMTPLYYQWIKWYVHTTQRPKSIQFVFLGDYKQGIYDFKGADIRFLTMAESLWKECSCLRNPIDFVYCDLNISYRITNQMCQFVNQVMLHSTRLSAKRHGKPVQYIRREYHNLIKILVYQIQQIIEQGDVPSDILILAASFKGSMSIGKRVENVLVSHGIPCYLPLMESDKLDERVIDGKVVFSTFHTVKGRQRKHVFVLGFDNSYFSRFGRHMERTQCPNTLYVACTRATHTLYVFESNQYRHDRPLEFLAMNHHEMKTCEFIDFKGHPQTLFDIKPDMNSHDHGHSSETCISISATDLVRFIPEHTLETLLPLLNKCFQTLSGNMTWSPVHLPNVVCFQNGLYEDISDLNGIAIPCMYYDWIYQQKLNRLNPQENENQFMFAPNLCILISLIFEIITEMNLQEHTFLKRQFLEYLQTRYHTQGIFFEHNLPIDEVLENKEAWLHLKQQFLQFRKPSSILWTKINKINSQTISDYLYLTNLLISLKEKLYYKIYQIQQHEYTWLSEHTIEQCLSNIHSIVDIDIFTTSEPMIYERVLIRPTMEHEHMILDNILQQYLPTDILQLGKFRFSARIDFDNGNTLWELKCCSTLSIEHMLQLVFYAWIHKHVYPHSSREYKMYNIKTNEVLQLIATKEELNILICTLLQGKYGSIETLNDQDFLAKLLH